ncbi:PucR family transcriptional regulator [Geodermatophilus ruber]|uniref:Transcriptional regulator, CdaR family n=1 Tax=Geodermatophilus ruber TaxID=504800 RepID=A0A1I4HEE1_9ACTN|nr:PucR family transcriptional regulator [Geodermatophilus ruber]SFL40053.1 transcriptional regulator, CdaR family [Geodermatophilus ruber]
MVVTLGEVLRLDAVQRAAPELVVGAELLDRPVRWVHTSELAEAAYLLKGGELLLTTGLGITGRGAVGEAAYVAALAQRGVAALALELGWTFPEAPAALIAACREHRLPLLVLREVVPFVEMTEQIQTALLDRAAEGARRERDVRQALTDALLDGAGPQDLTAVMAELARAPVVVTTADGALVAAAGLPPGASRRRGRPVARRDVVLLERHWGQVAVLPPGRADDPALPALVSYGAEALGLALLRSAAGGDLDDRRRQLLADLTERRWRAAGELVTRARVLGLSFPPDARYAALVVTDLGRADLDAVARAAAGALAPGSALVADLGADVVAVVRTSAVLAAARAVLVAVDALGVPSARVVAGAVVARLEDVDRSVARARSALRLAAAGERVVAAGQMTARLLLDGVRQEPLAEQLVGEELGRLIAHDAAHGSELVRTLRVYLAHSSSKVRTAEALRLRRQTLYLRLQRIEELIGDVHAPQRHAGLVVALALADLPGGGTRGARG